jgi:hypothetical protein
MTAANYFQYTQNKSLQFLPNVICAGVCSISLFSLTHLIHCQSWIRRPHSAGLVRTLFSVTYSLFLFVPELCDVPPGQLMRKQTPPEKTKDMYVLSASWIPIAY